MSNPLEAYLKANQKVEAVAGEIPVLLLQTFLGVVMFGDTASSTGEPMTLMELSEKLMTPNSTVGQHLQQLSSDRMSLVGTAPYPHNRRQSVFFLTPKGRALAARLRGILSGV